MTPAAARPVIVPPDARLAAVVKAIVAVLLAQPRLDPALLHQLQEAINGLDKAA